MPYNKGLEDRINFYFLESEKGLQEQIRTKKMFGGLAYLYRGKMSVGIVGDALMARIPEADMDRALLRRGARPMDFTGRVLKEFVFVDPEGYREAEDLERWIQWGLAHARAKLSENQ